MRRGLFWLRIFSLAVFSWIVFFAMTVHQERKQKYINIDSLNQTLNEALCELTKVLDENAELKQQVIVLSEKLKVNEKQQKTKKNKLKGPPEEYELLRRRILLNTKEFWYYVSSKWRELNKEFKNVSYVEKTRNMIDEHYRSLITNVIKLADVDGHARWRQQEHNYLSALIEKRLKYVQNPPDCSNAQKVVCQFDTNDWYAFGCRLHHLLNCMVTAYGSGRTMVMYNHDAWEFTSGGWNTLFLPLSDTCESVEGKTVAPWPRNSTHEPNTQVLTLVLPLITVNDSNRARPPFIPLILPEDLATRINVLHGDPGVWWIGQFLKYMLRPQKSISDKITAYAERIKFRTPCVGVHVRRTDKIKSEAALHNLDEYMYHVGEYYKIKELYDGRPCEKRIYLATDEPQVFDEAKLKYPDYEIIGDPEISKTGIPKARKSDNSLVNVFIDIHFLASCEYLVCTFSSNVCRIAYEIMNSVKPDASAMFTSLDDTYYFNDQIHRLNVAILPHKAEGPEEMDLQVGDQIEVAGNHWNGYSKGMNLRTKQFLLYPTFKVIPKIETIPFATYPNITINIDEFNEEINE